MANDDVEVNFTGDASGVEAAGRKTVDVVEQVRKKLTTTQSAVGNFGRAWAQALGIPTNAAAAQRTLDQIKEKSEKSKKEVNELSKALQTLGTGAGIAVIVKQAQEMSDSWTRSRNLLAAVGVESQQLSTTQADLVRIAKETRTALEPTVSLYSRMYRSVVPLGYAQQDVARATEIVNKAFKAGGAAVSEQNAAILQLSQSLGAGALQGDELRSVRENAPLVAKAIADEFGTTIAGLKALGEKGELITSRVFDGIINGGAAIDAQFANTIPTIADAFVNLQTSLVQYAGGLNEASGASQAVAGAINLLGDNIGPVIDAVIILGTAIGVGLAAKALPAFVAQMILAGNSTGILAVRLAVINVQSAVASRGIMGLAASAGVARAAFAVMLGPIGLAITAAVAMAAAFDFMRKSAEDARDWGAEIASTTAKLQAMQASADDFDEDKFTRTGSAMEGMGSKTETAAEKVDRLNRALQAANLAEYNRKLAEAGTIIEQTAEQLGELERAADAVNNSWQNMLFGGGADIRKTETYTNAKLAAEKRIQDAKELTARIEGQGVEGQDSAAQDAANDAIIAEFEVREFAARNNAQQELAIMREKTQTIKNIYGDESKEYQRAVKDMERAEKSLTTSSKSEARERERAVRDAQKDALEQYDLQLEAAEDNKSESLRIIAEKLAKLKEFYGEDSREYARGLQEQIRIRRRFDDQERAMAQRRIQANSQYAQTMADQEFAAKQDGVRRQATLVDAAIDQQVISEVRGVQLKGAVKQEEITNEIAHQDRIFQLQRQALQEQLQLEGLKVEARVALLDQLVQLEAEHNGKVAALQRNQATETRNTQLQTANAVAASWSRVLTPITSSFNGMFKSLYNGTMGWTDAFLQALDNIMFAFIDMGVQMVTQWAANQLAMTAAAQAGAASRVATKTAETGTVQSLSAGEAMGQILNYAWTAAAGAFSAMAGIPYIGPILAVAAGAAALAAVMGFAGNLFSAEGGMGTVPFDGAITELHKNEMVLPAKFANPLRNMLTGVGVPAGPGAISETAGTNYEAFRQNNTSVREGDTNLYYSPQTNVNNVSLASLLRREGTSLRKWMKNESRNNFGRSS